jgi:hypothetical protein
MINETKIRPLDVFNKEYVPLTDAHKFLINEIKEKAEALWGCFVRFDAPREMELATAKLEEAVMWSTKGIANWCKQNPEIKE